MNQAGMTIQKSAMSAVIPKLISQPMGGVVGEEKQTARVIRLPRIKQIDAPMMANGLAQRRGRMAPYAHVQRHASKSPSDIQS